MTLFLPPGDNAGQEMVGTVTLSIEVELAWGFHDLPPRTRGRGSPLSADRSAETGALDRLLARCDRLDVPITFDVVGHLGHDGCDGHAGSPHAQNWFDADPTSNAESDPLFYAPELVRAIGDASADHEVATHTYSHVLCDDVPNHVLDWELDAVEAVHEDLGLDPPVSFVPPRHRRPDPDVLRAHGIRIVRVPAPGTSIPTARHRRFVRAFTRSPVVEAPRRSDGIVETYCSPAPSLTAPHLASGQRPAHPAFSALPTAVRQWLHRRYLDRCLEEAIERGSSLHLWTHLYDLSNDVQWPPIRSFLASLAAARNQGRVAIRTMERLAGHVEGRTEHAQ